MELIVASGRTHVAVRAVDSSPLQLPRDEEIVFFLTGGGMPPKFKGPLVGADFATFLTALRAGQLYVNVHTLQNPAGELRANFPAPPGPPATGSTEVHATSGSDAIFYAAAALTGAGALAFGAGAFARRGR